VVKNSPISGLIARLDELLAEAARLSSDIRAAMRREQRPFWPDRRRESHPHDPDRRQPY
jgi:hypothetical protein